MKWDVKQKRALLRRQNAEVYPNRKMVKVTCICGRKLNIMHAYKCYFCRLWFCWTCAGAHFKKREIRWETKMAELTCEAVKAIFGDCLFMGSEIIDGKPVVEPIIIEGIVNRFSLHPQRLESHRQEIIDLLKELPEVFRRRRDGGWSFLNMCDTKDGHRWGEHMNMEQLLVLGMGIKKARYLFPRELWKAFPGDMPYIVIF